MKTPGVLWLAAVTGVSGIAIAQSDEPTLDELLGLEPPRETTTPDMGEEKAELQELADGIDPNDRLRRAVNEMNAIARRLGRSFDAGIDTQRMQEEVLRRLDQVIEAARQQQQQSSSSGSSSSGSPRDADSGSQQIAGQSSAGKRGQEAGQAQSEQAGLSGGGGGGDGTSGEGEGPSFDEVRREWGNLPPRLRDELLDGRNERFSPVYRGLTERYYQELAELQAEAARGEP